MKIYKIFIIFIIMLMSVSLYSKQRVIPMDDILKPRLISMDDKQFYVSESTATVSIFSSDSFKLIKKFGKSGEGPREFMLFALVTPLEDKLLINSIGKISYYKKDGTFIDEIKSPGGAGGGFGFIPLGKGFVAQGRAGDEKGLYSVISYFDEKLNKKKELYRLKIAGKGFSKIDVLRASVPYQAYNDTVFVPGEKGFLVNAINKDGKIVFKIERKDYKPRKFSKKVERQIRDLIKKQNPRQYEFLKNKMVFGDYFPIFSFFYKDPKAKMLYLFTWNFKDSDFECFIYDMEGNFQKRATVPFKMQGTLQPYPLMIYDWKVYQLIDNDETEQWELHITDIK